jgi:uncharacterized protein YbjT (DUF2867 family)
VNHQVLLLGGTGRTGGRVLSELLGRGVPVRAIVRTAARVREDAAGHPDLTVIEADLVTMSDADLRRHMSDCTAVVSCLGHTLSLSGIFGPPRDLVARTAERVCAAAEELRPDGPARFVLMTSVSVNRPRRADSRRGVGERAYMRAIRGLVPPARDNQRAADVLAGGSCPSLEWVVVRPDSLVDGDRTEYHVHEGIVASLFQPDTSRFVDIAHFIADLVADQAVWRRWRGGMPVIVSDADSLPPTRGRHA